MAAVLIWVFSIYIGLAVISLTLPYVAFRVERKPNQSTIDDYVRWMNNNDDGAKYTTLSWVPILNIVTMMIAVVVAITAIADIIYDKIKDIKIV